MNSVPSWLEDPNAYAQSANLELSTVLIVALANLLIGVCFVAVFEIARRKTQLRYFWPKESLLPGSTPVGVTHGEGAVFSLWPLAWVRPLMRLDEEELLRCGGYDVVVYLRFISMSLKIFGCFAPYALLVLLPVNIAGSLKNSDGGENNSFNMLSMANMPKSSKLMWAHCLGVVLLTGISMHWLARECRWYMRLRHRFLTETHTTRQRTVFVKQVPVELRSSTSLAAYFHKLYPDSVVGVVAARKLGPLTSLVAQRDAAMARHERCASRRLKRKLKLMNASSITVTGCNPEAHQRLLEDLYDPLFYMCSYTLAERCAIHAAAMRRLEEQIQDLRKMHSKVDALIGRPKPTTPDKSEVSSDSFEKLERPSSFGSYDDMEDEDDYVGRGIAFEDWGETTPSRRRYFWPSGLKKQDTEATSLLGEDDERRTARVVGDKAFVTFSSFGAAAVATQVFHAATPGGMVAKMAPEAQDVVWSNLHVTAKQRTLRKFVANALVALLFVFYVVPVTLLNLILSETALKSRSSYLRDLCAKSYLAEAAVKMFQPLGLISLMLLLPPAFLALGLWEGELSWSANTLTQLSRYYTFQITNVLLVTTVAGSFLKVLNRVLDDPSQTFVLLGTSLPQVCAFFSCYIFIKALSGLTLELCRGVAFGQQLLKRLLYPSTTPRDRAAEFLGLRDLENPGWFSYGKYGAQDLLVVVLLMTYSVMAPVILVPGLLFFGWAAVVYRHQLLYVYVPIFESGGLLWPRIYRRTLFSLFILQATMVGLFFLKHAFYQGYVVMALAAATYLYKERMRALYTMSGSVAHHLPMELAVALDEAMLQENDPEDRAKLLRGLRAYLQPPLQSTNLPPKEAENNNNCDQSFDV